MNGNFIWFYLIKTVYVPVKAARYSRKSPSHSAAGHWQWENVIWHYVQSLRLNGSHYYISRGWPGFPKRLKQNYRGLTTFGRKCLTFKPPSGSVQSPPLPWWFEQLSWDCDCLCFSCATVLQSWSTEYFQPLPTTSVYSTPRTPSNYSPKFWTEEHVPVWAVLSTDGL